MTASPMSAERQGQGGPQRVQDRGKQQAAGQVSGTRGQCRTVSTPQQTVDGTAASHTHSSHMAKHVPIISAPHFAARE